MTANGTLCALLACPPTTSGVRTLNALGVAARCLQFTHLTVGNLLSVPARDMSAMSEVGVDADLWKAARVDVEQALGHADGLIAAWGVGPLAGPARRHHRDQIEWLIRTAQAAGHTITWTLGGQPRHPSRWHQFASDRHGRTSPGLSREDRVSRLLVQVPLAELETSLLRPAGQGAGAVVPPVWAGVQA